MIKEKRGIVLIICILFLILNSYSQQKNDKNKIFIEKAREYTTRFYNKDFENLYNKFSEEMKNEISLSYLSDFHIQVLKQIGVETKILDEQIDSTTTQYIIYNRISSFDKYKTPIYIRWVLDKQMTICGFLITISPPEAESKYLDYKTKSDLKLPFEGEWFVFWGGRTYTENNHTPYPTQRFAYDFVQTNEGKTHTGSGNKNEDYFCFGKSIYAPSCGKIVEIENQVEDNIPGEMNSYQAAGNYVIVDHGNGEFSFMAHFKKGSILVKKGDLILKGQEIGKCGNSGNSSEPHLHYHIQNTSFWEGGDGLPAQFRNYIANGEKVSNGEPHRGQIIKNDE